MATSFATTITQLRKRKGISQKKAAGELGVSQALLSHYENGIRECGLDFVLRVANYYGVSCDYLLGNSNSSISFDMVENINDIPQDGEISINTLYRASAIVGARFFKNFNNGEKMMNLYAIAGYFMILKGVESGYVPQNWVGTHIPTKEQLQFLQVMSVSMLDDIEKNPKPCKPQEVPVCVKTITDWTSTFLNESLAELII